MKCMCHYNAIPERSKFRDEGLSLASGSEAFVQCGGEDEAVAESVAVGAETGAGARGCVIFKSSPSDLLLQAGPAPSRPRSLLKYHHPLGTSVQNVSLARTSQVQTVTVPQHTRLIVNASP